MYKQGLFILLLLLLALVACSGNNEEEYSTHNPTPEEILSQDKDADIFVEDDLVYINAKDIDWVNEEELTIGKEIGEIKKQSTNSEEFESFTASKLPVGTKIYETNEDVVGGYIYIVKKDGEEIRYVGLPEG